MKMRLEFIMKLKRLEQIRDMTLEGSLARMGLTESY